MDEMKELSRRIKVFNEERDWRLFHTPKNLAMALVVEAAELAEIFQWITEERSDALTSAEQGRAKEEIADVLIYLVNLADRLGIDPVEAALEKLEVNRAKYPVNLARGKAEKARDLR